MQNVLCYSAMLLRYKQSTEHFSKIFVSLVKKIVRNKDEVPIKIVDEFKYLGVNLHSKFDFYAHIQLIENKISRTVGIISKLLLLTLYSNYTAPCYIPISYIDSLLGDPLIKHT